MNIRINKRIEALAQELQDLFQQKDRMHFELNRLETRIHQVNGSLYELNLLLTDEVASPDLSIHEAVDQGSS